MVARTKVRKCYFCDAPATGMRCFIFRYPGRVYWCARPGKTVPVCVKGHVEETSKTVNSIKKASGYAAKSLGLPTPSSRNS